MNLNDIGLKASRIPRGSDALDAVRESLGPVGVQGLKLANRILEQCRVRLMMSLRFMDRALWQLPFVPTDLTRMLSTDSRSLHFDPDAVIDAYSTNSTLVTRTYLHAVMHCVLRHPLYTVRANTRLWSLACDMCVEGVVLELCDGRLHLETDDSAQRVLTAFSDLGVPLTPAGIYRALLLWQTEPCPNELVATMVANEEAARTLFARDSHKLWALFPEQPSHDQSGDGGQNGDGESGQQDGNRDNAEGDSSSEGNPQGEGEEAPAGDGVGSQDGQDGTDESPSDGEQGNAGQSDQLGEDEDDQNRSGGPGETQENGRDQSRSAADGGGQPASMAGSPDDGTADNSYEEGALAEPSDLRDPELEELWKSIAADMETALQTLDRRRGEGAGRTMSNLSLASRSHADYEAFLNRFATIAEDIKLNSEEFDYLFYTYGLERYGNMPLIEPLEYCEDKRIRDFVIALDTSSSCSNGLTRIFLTRTYEILRKSVKEEDRVSIHIIQCDADVQSDTVITCLEDIVAYVQDMRVAGLGGTDFRPVFAYVDQLLEEGAFTDLRGLVYFTDGIGVYPEYAPAYDVAFVFVENEGEQRRVPPWACKVIMTDDEIEQLGWS